jgi:hypothetical protein
MLAMISATTVRRSADAVAVLVGEDAARNINIADGSSGKRERMIPASSRRLSSRAWALTMIARASAPTVSTRKTEGSGRSGIGRRSAMECPLRHA